jgi:Helix-turn-helix
MSTTTTDHHEVLVSVDAVQNAYAHHGRARWVVLDADALGLLADAVHVDDRWHRLLLLQRASTARRELLHALFRVVVAPDDGVRLLPPAELAGVMADGRAVDLFIGGVVDTDDKALVLYRGNLDRLVVPLDWFKPRPKARPDFDAFAVVDHGQTVQLGEYEAAGEAILYEFDADARRRMKERKIKQDSSFGGALRRLRLARGLARSEFAPLAEKTVARIERGEVEEPHGDTLAIIAKRLGVKADKIKSY